MSSDVCFGSQKVVEAEAAWTELGKVGCGRKDCVVSEGHESGSGFARGIGWFLHHLLLESLAVHSSALLGGDKKQLKCITPKRSF